MFPKNTRDEWTFAWCAMSNRSYLLHKLPLMEYLNRIFRPLYRDIYINDIWKFYNTKGIKSISTEIHYVVIKYCMSCKIICTLVGKEISSKVNSSCYHLLFLGSFKSSCLDPENLIAIKDESLNMKPKFYFKKRLKKNYYW